MAEITVSFGGIVKTSLVTAFTIAVALIWKDFIVEVIALLVPPGEEVLYKFIAAVLSTAAVIIAIYLVLETESEAETLVKKIRTKKSTIKVDISHKNETNVKQP
ncbi:MAG: DUF5654 family protein [Candidatus Diapherotrites archaeon]